MGDIYHLADCVIFWLDTEKDNSTRVLRSLSQLSLEIKVDYANLAMSPASSKSDPQWSDTREVLAYFDYELRDLDTFLRRPWFSRLWVWQEIRLAKNNAIAICGSDTIPWQSFLQAIFCISLKQGLGNIPPLEFHRQRSATQRDC